MSAVSETKHEKLSIRLDGRIKTALEDAAKKDHRKLSSLVAMILDNWVATNATGADLVAARRSIIQNDMMAILPQIEKEIKAKSAARVAKLNPTDAGYRAAKALLRAETDAARKSRLGKKTVAMTPAELKCHDANRTVRRREDFVGSKTA